MNHYDKLAARIRARTFKNPNDLAREFAAAFSALARQPSVQRGLARDVLADVQGGTKLGVGEPSASHISAPLVTGPQTGKPTQVGSLQTRHQSRIETKTIELPGIVTQNALAGDRTLQVRVVGKLPFITIDETAGTQVPGDVLKNLAESGINADNVNGTDYVATVTGQPFVSPGSTGWQPPTKGQTVPVTISRQWQVDTVWTKRLRKWVPNVAIRLMQDTATVKNGMAFILNAS
jgi:hypothetical protein